MLYNQQISWRHLHGGTRNLWCGEQRLARTWSRPSTSWHFHIAPMAAGGKSLYLSSAHTGCPKAVRIQEKMRTKKTKIAYNKRLGYSGRRGRRVGESCCADCCAGQQWPHSDNESRTSIHRHPQYNKPLPS